MDQTTRIGRYALVRRVGSGAYATVWLAYDDELDAEVALKILSDNWVDDSDVRSRFLAEGRFLRRVESPHVVSVHDVGQTDDGRPYLVLTFADGGSLADRMRQGPLDIATVVDVISQVGVGLQQLHRRGVLHRDVKPDNVLFRSEPDDGERAMLGDLGLGKSLDNASRLTMAAGTPAYVAPEQVRGDPLDPQADLYSLGAVAYAAFSGEPPHGATSLAAVLRIDSPPPPIGTVRNWFPAAVDAVVRRALEPDREQRWPDLDSFLAALRSAQRTGAQPAGSGPGEAIQVRSTDGGPAAPAGTGSAAPAASGSAALADSGSAAPIAGSPVAASAAESSGAADSSVVAPAAADDAAAPAATADPAVRRQSARRWVVAGAAAVLLAVAGGIASYELMSRRPAEVTADRFSVEVPRSWKQTSANGWVPAPGQPTQPSLLVSTDTTAWPRDAKVPGVFLGVLKAGALPSSAPTPRGCRSEGSDRDPVDTRPAVTFRFDCGGNPPVVERYVQTTRTDVVRIQIRSTDAGELADVLASARSSG